MLSARRGVTLLNITIPGNTSLRRGCPSSTSVEIGRSESESVRRSALPASAEERVSNEADDGAMGSAAGGFFSPQPISAGIANVIKGLENSAETAQTRDPESTKEGRDPILDCLIVSKTNPGDFTP